MAHWKRIVLGSVVALLLVLNLPMVVRAHAELVRSKPTDGAALDRPPERVQLFFSEPIEREFFALEVYNQNRVRVDQRDARIPPDNVAALEASLGTLGLGTYTVVWRVLSIDGHVVRGTFAFSVGAAAPGATPLLNIAASGTPLALGATVRWWTFLAAFILVGGLGFLPLILEPALHAAGVADPRPAQRATRRLLWLAWPAVVLLFGLSLGALLLQAADATGLPLAEVFSGRAITRLLTSTKYGLLWLVRMGFLLGLLAVVAVLSAERRLGRWFYWIGLGFGAGLLLTISASGHASAVPRQTALAIAADWVHLIAGAIWVGGLIQLGLALPAALDVLKTLERRVLLARVIRRFSGLASLSVAVLVVTGTYAGLIHIPSWQALLDTVYGATLSGKLLLFIPLLMLGAINLLIVGPRFVRAAHATLEARQRLSHQEVPSPIAASKQRTKANTRQPWSQRVSKQAQAVRTAWAQGAAIDNAITVRRFRIIVLGEIGLAILILAVTGILAGEPPATSATADQPFRQTQRTGNLNVTLAVTPNQVGTNRLEVAVTDREGRPVVAERVMLRLEHQEMDMGQREVPMQAARPGQYQVSGGFLSMAGRWQAEVRIQGAGPTDEQAMFQFMLGQAVGTNRPAFSPMRILINAITLRAVLGVYALGGAAYILVSRANWRRARSRRWAPYIAAVLVAIGTWAVGSSLVSGYRESLPNPVPATAASLARGQHIYAQNCASCHGTRGRGNGPAAARLSPGPADLRVHMEVSGTTGHTDRQIFEWIANGVEGTGMPAFRNQLSEEDIWHVINYIRTFAENEEASAP
jgi:copper transport protein